MTKPRFGKRYRFAIVIVDERGRFLDPALVAQARVVLALAGRASPDEIRPDHRPR